MTVLSNNRQLLRLIFGFKHHPVPVPPASFISLTFMPKPVLWYFLDSRKYRPCSYNKNPRRGRLPRRGKGMLV